MKRALSLILLGMTFSIAALAQEDNKFYFEDYTAAYATQSINPEVLPKHFLGESIARKMYLLNQTYTRIEEATDVNPIEKTIVDKPTIYYSVKKLSNYYKKQIKSGAITEDEAREKLNQFLDICLSIYAQNTITFEQALKTSKSENEIEQVFSLVEFD